MTRRELEEFCIQQIKHQQEPNQLKPQADLTQAQVLGATIDIRPVCAITKLLVQTDETGEFECQAFEAAIDMVNTGEYNVERNAIL